MENLTLADLAVKHSYYCSDSNYYSNDAHLQYNNWSSFYQEFKDVDKDYNFCFRWDITENEEEKTFYMEVFMMQQRKGKFVPIMIDSVVEENVPEIVSFLQGYKEYIDKLWKPL